MYRLRDRIIIIKKTNCNLVWDHQGMHIRGIFPVRCWYNPWTDFYCDVALIFWQWERSRRQFCSFTSCFLQRQQQRRCWVSFFHPLSPHFFYIFNLVTASLISLDLKPPRETGREWYRRKMRGKKNPASNLVKVSFEKSIFLCDKICLRLFVLWNQPIILWERMKEVASVVWNNSD